MCASLSAAYDALLEASTIEQIRQAVLETLAVASDEICRQLAYHYAGDNANFDVMRLAYSLCSYHEINTQAMRYVTNGCQPSATRLSMKLLQEAIKVGEEWVACHGCISSNRWHIGSQVIFVRMSEDGLWRKGEPILRQSLNVAGRDIGNAYVFAFDVLSTLVSRPLARYLFTSSCVYSLRTPLLLQLQVFSAESELFLPHVERLERCASLALHPHRCLDSLACMTERAYVQAADMGREQRNLGGERGLLRDQAERWRAARENTQRLAQQPPRQRWEARAAGLVHGPE
jgi:hypothetical protein